MNHELILYILTTLGLLQLNKHKPLQQEDIAGELAVFVHPVLLWIKKKSECLNRLRLILVKTILFSTYYSMKTRKVRKSKKSRKGGFLGIRALKTRTENIENCQRLADNFQKRDDFLYRKYKCKTPGKHKYKELCDGFDDTQVEMRRECAQPKMIDDYDFGRDGLRVKKRTQTFFGLDKLPKKEDIDLTRWKNMNYHFKPVGPEDEPEYVLKTENEITQKYNEEN